MLQCQSCSHHPEMSFVSKEKVLPTSPSSGVVARQQRKAGHPIIAGILTVYNVVAGATNFFFEAKTYKCPSCGSIKTVTTSK